ncbi:MAG TPA: glycosyltransferase family 2 protein [Longimicrobiales bacterium]
MSQRPTGAAHDVSVVIPFYNGGATLQRAVASIEAQTLSPGEIVIVDDGSPTPLPVLQSGRVPVRVLRHEQNRGIPGARNAGIAAAQGRLLAFLDQDDEWAPDKLERQLAAHAATPDAVVFGRLRHRGEVAREWSWPPDAAVQPLEQGGDAALRALIRWGNAVPFVTLLVPRRVFETSGPLDERLRGGADDYEFVLRLVAEGVSLRFDGAGAAGWSAVHHYTGANYSAHAPRWLRDDFELIDRLAARYPLIAARADEARARFHYTMGRHHDGAGDRAEARRHYEQAVRLAPLWLRPRVARAWLRLPGPVARATDRLARRVGLLRG